MAKKIPEFHLQYPEWEQQENEKNKEKEAFDCYCVHGGSVRHCARDLKQVQKGSNFHGITLKYKPYNEHYFRKLAKKHKFEHRRNLKDKYELEYRNRKFDEIERKTIIDRYQKTDDAEVATGELLENLLSNDEINGTQTKDFVTALNGYQEYKRKLRGEDETQKLVVDAEVKKEVKTDVKKELEEVQKEILSPSFGEVTRKLSTHLTDEK